MAIPRDRVTFTGAPGMSTQEWSAMVRHKDPAFEQYLVREVERLHKEAEERLGVSFARADFRLELV